MLTDKQEPFVRAIILAGMPTDRAGLRGIMGINRNRHTSMRESFLGDHALQFSKGPLRLADIGFPLLCAGFLASLAFGAVSNVGRVLKANERMRMGTHNPLTHDMISVGFQPSLPSTDDHQSPGRRTGAFLLQTLSSPCVMIGLGNDGFARMEGPLPCRRRCYGKIADTDIDPNDIGMHFGCRVCSFHFQ